MSQVTGPLDLSQCHTCPMSQLLLTKSLADWPNIRVQNYYKKKMAKLQAFSFFLPRTVEIFTGHGSHPLLNFEWYNISLSSAAL